MATVELSGSINASASMEGNLNAFYAANGNALVETTMQGNLTSQMNLSGTAQVSAVMSGNATFVGAGLTVKEVVKEILLLWGIEDPAIAIPALRARAIHDLNAAHQLIFSRAKELNYFNSLTIEAVIAANTDSVLLSQSIQSITGAIRRKDDLANLRPIASRAQYELFPQIFLGSLTTAHPTGKPAYYFLERNNQSKGDNVKLNLFVTPIPTEETTLLLDVSIECPRYVWNDYCIDSKIFMPHKYGEILLLPIVRFLAMSSHYFIAKEQAPAIAEEYKIAMQTLGLLEPEPKAVTGSNKP